MLTLILAAALRYSEANVRTAYETASNLVEKCTPREAGTLRGRLAANFLLDAAASAGANARLDVFTADTPVGMRHFTNVVAMWNVNPTGKWVVVVSHYDTKPFTKCPGANDGASTSGLLVGLAEAISDARQPPCNMALMWLDGEECMFAYGQNDGLWGSRRASEIWKTLNFPTKAVICLDMLGDADLRISIPRNSSPSLRALALAAARQTKNASIVSELGESVKDDHVPFATHGFPAIDLIDFEFGSAAGLNDYWHTEHDTIDKISMQSLAKSGRIVCCMINTLAGVKPQRVQNIENTNARSNPPSKPSKSVKSPKSRSVK